MPAIGRSLGEDPLRLNLAISSYLLALAVFGLPTAGMGALFCQLSAEAEAAGQPFSRALGVNTLGAMAAAPLFGVALDR